jgi:hypothetical protein
VCAVPASPELALVPDTFEVLEAEVIEMYGGTLAYNLSLSAEPVEPVIVTITSEIRSPSCYGYEPKFTLPTSQFEFTAETYNVNQTVQISVSNLNASKYEGSFSASFYHTLVTEDEVFQVTTFPLYFEKILFSCLLPSLSLHYLIPASVLHIRSLHVVYISTNVLSCDNTNNVTSCFRASSPSQLTSLIAPLPPTVGIFASGVCCIARR